VFAAGAAAKPTDAIADCSATSPRDLTGQVIDVSLDTTTVLVGAPAEVRADAQVSFDWKMTPRERWTGGRFAGCVAARDHVSGGRSAARLADRAGEDRCSGKASGRFAAMDRCPVTTRKPNIRSTPFSFESCASNGSSGSSRLSSQGHDRLRKSCLAIAMWPCATD
jgi:hypothetical protein